MPAKRAVVFDLDGTLLDSLPDLAGALNRSLARYGLAPIPQDEVRPMVGDGSRKLLERGYAAHDRTPSDEDFAIYMEDYEAHATDLTTLFDGIDKAVAALEADGYGLGVCSNKPHDAAERVLKSLGIAHYFLTMIGGDQTEHRKPDPRHLGAVLEAMGVKPRDAIMVGDHRNDLATAKGLGSPAIFAGWGYGEADAQVVAHKPAELPGLVKQIFARDS